MRKLTRFISGCLFGGALLTAAVAAAPAPAAAQRQLVLTCTESVCCTIDSQTGEIISCKRIS
ncbi:MAG TPA: hypothetical protein VFJ82_11745 [Longimicrobium sp.]|nr:hypothetical protein [Longimicrobium sp.]